MASLVYQCPRYELKAGGESALCYRAEGTGEWIAFSWPEFEIDGERTSAPGNVRETGRRRLNEDIEEITLEGTLDSGLTLKMTLRVCPATPFIRFRYAVSSAGCGRLTKRRGEHLVYLTYPGGTGGRRTEVRFSTYDSLLHGYCLKEIPAFEHENELIGPILAEEREGVTLLTAYEHGSMDPDRYVVFARTEDGIAIRALRGNYWDRQPVGGAPYETIWLEAGAVPGGLDDLARAYREFQLMYCTLNRESRKPYIFYNTWAFQERNKFYNRRNYLTSMNRERMEREIEIAHRMGVDVFVIDTGWYRKTGDWETDLTRFPEGMRHIHDLLAARGMKLGLWFGPTSAAKSSRILARHPGCVAGWRNETSRPYPVWETEESYSMCLVSEYWQDFADRLIELAKTVGVRYFKWDAVDMFGCDRPGHFHGDEDTPAGESHDCFRFQVGIYMQKIVDRLCEEVPDAIVDMDITEGRRYFGLGFLASGKFFSMNNGPYYPNYDIQMPDDTWSNIFVNPGPARTWVCRQNLMYDRWIPSVLLMAHYLPDDPESSQNLNLASLMLGQNGVWGDLPGVSEEGVARFGRILGLYKRLRDDITRAYPVVYGRPGETFEVHEKINGENGRGMVAVFGNQPGEYAYRLASAPKGDPAVIGPASLRRENGETWIDARFDQAGAAIIFFNGA